MLQMSIDSLQVEEQDMITGLAAEEQPLHVATPYWVPFPSTFHMPAQEHDEQSDANSKTQYPNAKAIAYADLLSPTWNLNEIQSLDPQDLDNSSTLENLLQTGHPQMLFLDQCCFNKFLTPIFMLYLNTWPYPTLDDLIHITGNKNNTFACELSETWMNYS